MRGLGAAARGLRQPDLSLASLGAGPHAEVDPVWWSPSGFHWRLHKCRRHVRPILPEFRRQMVELVRAGRSTGGPSREFEPTAQSISNWVAQADEQEGRREEKVDGLAAAERDELARLRRENKQLRLERDILSRAAAWFARETGADAVRVFEFMSANQAVLPDRGHGARAGRVGVRLSCVATAPGLCSRGGRRCAAQAGAHHPCQFARDIWGAARPCRAAGRRGEARSQTDRAADARGRSGWC